MNKKKKHLPAQPITDKQKAKHKTQNITQNKKTWIALLAILSLTIISYWPALSNGFVNLDDDRYIETNQMIRHFNLKLLFSSFWMGNYHPFVMMVYTWIYSMVGLEPKLYHIINLSIHLINTALVLYVIRQLTDVFEIAVIVSFLFGIHPIHVESVAWVSELKDLMYTAFFLASLYCYIKYLKNNFNRKYFLLSIIFFLCSLLSKGMGVSLAVVLILVDYFMGRKIETKIFIEKIPYFVLAIIFGIVAIKAQQELGAIQDAVFTFPQRIVFACYGFVTYIFKIIIPINLSAYYPYPAKTNESIPGIFYLYPVIFAAMVAVVFYSFKKTNKVFFSIAFYAITVALVLQLLPVGGAVIADRYSYIPSIGIFLLIAFSIYELYKKVSYKSIATIIVLVLTGSYSVATYNRTKVWKDGMTLWTDVIEKGNEVALAYNNRGVLYKQNNELDLAMKDYKHSLKLNPRNQDTWSNIGLIFWQQGIVNKINQRSLNDTAIRYLNKAIDIDPNFATAYSNRGSVRSTMGDNTGAINDYTRSIEIDPNFNDAYYNRGIVYYNSGKKTEACTDLNKAAQLGHKIAPAAVHDLCK